jgi:glycosyltransferase involved in cell wall biosynthesis
MVSSLWPPAVIGGAELYAATLARHLREAGHDVAAVTLGVEGDDVVAAVHAWPVGVQDVRGSTPWRRLLFHGRDVWRGDVSDVLARAVAAFRPDVIHTHAVHGMSTAALTAPSRLGVPHVHTLHDFWLRCWRSTLTRRDGGSCGPACRAIASWRSLSTRRGPAVTIAISNAILEQHRALPWSAGARVLRHPLEEAPVRRRSLPAPGQAVFGYLGQLNPNKGVRVLLDAHRQTGYHLLIAGKGRLESAVRDAASDRLRYIGWVAGTEREQFFDSIDCLVVPSTWCEPAGLVVNEAAARGIPVVASDAGGLPEYVPDACRPLLSVPGDDGDLALRMKTFAEDPESFQPGAPDPARTWGAHVADVVGAYAAAGAWAA